MNNRPESENQRIDRRKNRTKRQLKEALFALILEKGYDAVTVEDITERADLGRTTFYLHYHDKEELLLEAIDSISDELMAQISPIPANSLDEQRRSIWENPRNPIRVVFRHAADNAALYRIILRGEGATKAAGKVRDIISTKLIQTLRVSAENGLPIQMEVPEEVFANYFAGALLGMLTWWLESGEKYPPDEVAEMFRKMFFQGGRATLGLVLPGSEKA